MNAAYNYKTSRNNISLNTHDSKKGTCKKAPRREAAYTDLTDKCLSVIDMIIDLLFSAKVIVAAKAAFGFIALIGLLGIIGGIEFGTLSLLSGVICLGIIIALEFFALKD